MKDTIPNSYKLIWQTVQQIPKGKVATYEQVAELSGLAGQQRLVGYAMHNLPEDTNLPWHRVINAKAYKTQKLLLEKEGINKKFR